MIPWTLSLQSQRYQPGFPSSEGSSRTPVSWEVFFVVATHSRGARFSHQRTFNLADGNTPPQLRRKAYLERGVLLAQAHRHLAQLQLQLEEGLFSPARDPDWVEILPVPGSPSARVAAQVRAFLSDLEEWAA